MSLPLRPKPVLHHLWVNGRNQPHQSRMQFARSRFAQFARSNEGEGRQRERLITGNAHTARCCRFIGQRRASLLCLFVVDWIQLPAVELKITHHATHSADHSYRTTEPQSDPRNTSFHCSVKLHDAVQRVERWQALCVVHLRQSN